MKLPKKELDTWLNEVDYSQLESGDYVPSIFALQFMNFIKEVNGDKPEDHVTPPVHLKMLDKLASPSKRLANLCFRGAAKTTLFMEYLVLYLAMFGNLPGLGELNGMLYVSDSMDNGVKSAKENIEFRYNNSEYLQYWIPKAKFTEKQLEFENRDGHKFMVKMYGARTGIRGSKIYADRPVLVVLDDLVGNETANSDVSMDRIKDTVYKDVVNAMDPIRYKIVFNGTPFDKEDVLVEAIESGGWDVNVWPVCEKFPCEKKNFRGAWPDRFPYEAVLDKYELAVSTGHLPAFMQELMLRISSQEGRLVQDSEIKWYKRTELLARREMYNFYITTDVAVSENDKANRSVISVWAYNSNGDWFWVDGVVHQKTINHTWDELFRLVAEYHPQSVGIETTGQQMAFIDVLSTEMLRRNIWFTFALGQNGKPGIHPHKNKLIRFNVVVPWFKSGKMYFPIELQTSVIMGECMGEICLITQDGFRGKDDFTDTISMLGYMHPWKPSAVSSPTEGKGGLWETPVENRESPLDSYIC